MKFELPAHEPQLIGRSSESLTLSDTTISRRHAELTPDDGEWYVRDLESANGTFVNGRRLSAADGRVQLAPGDQIRCGATLFIFATTPDEGRRSTAVQLVEPEAMDVTIERRSGGESSHETRLGEPGYRSDSGHSDAAEHLRVIYDLTALTAAAFERDELLGRVMDLVFAEFRPERGFILLVDEETGRTEPVVVRYKVKPKTLDEGRIPVSRTIVQHTLERGEGVLSTNAMCDERFRSGDSVRDYGIRSAICVPIRAGRRALGVIHIDSSLASFTFSESQLQLLSAIGQHTGLALLNADLIAQKMQTERLAAMGQTVASLSHSVKNILQGLRGGADAVEVALNRGDMALVREGWPILARNLDRIYALTLNMLAYSKHRSLDVELGSVQTLIREAVELIQPQCDRKGVALLLELAEDMPPIPMDTSAMHQALVNVLTNAVEAAPAKKGAITIRTRFDPGASEAQIAVSDNGPGVPPAQREKIFEPFASSKGQRGTGLGLAVTRKIVEEHCGRIELAPPAPESRGKGATFIITLPSDTTAISAGDTRLPQPMRADLVVDEFDDE
jgi:two-component system, NtrC family, sensor kinase